LGWQRCSRHHFWARVREADKWSGWNELHFSTDHGVDARVKGQWHKGTNPFMTAVADGIEVIMINKTGGSKDLKVDLIGSQETKQDRALLSNVRTLDAAEHKVMRL
jgi:hypothetical protein